MINGNRIADIIHSNKVSSDFIKTDIKSLVETIDICKDYIASNAKRDDINKSREDNFENSVRLIDSFVNRLNFPVEGFSDEDGLSRLRKTLIDEILKYKAITELMENPDVGEIRINSRKNIYYEKGGKIYRWHKIFNSNEELGKVLELLLGTKAKLDLSTRFVDGRTIEGYRVNATHTSISPSGEYSCVIRKFKKAEDKLKVLDLVKFRSVSDNMVKLLKLFVKAHISVLMIGSTGSGKTVSNETLLVSNIDLLDRTVFIENPAEYTPQVEESLVSFSCSKMTFDEIVNYGYSEITSSVLTKNPSIKESYTGSIGVKMIELDQFLAMLKQDFEDKIENIVVEKYTGIHLNDFIQLEAATFSNPTPSDHTPNNLVENSLRQTPTWIVVGEVRSDDEFAVVLKAGTTGHCVITTFHANDDRDAVRRYLTAMIGKYNNVPPELLLGNIISAFRIILNVEKLRDGSRKMMTISEVVGQSGIDPIIKRIYEFEMTEVDDKGKIHGTHVRKNAISPEIVKQFRKMTIPDREFEIFKKEPADDGEKELYNGEE